MKIQSSGNELPRVISICPLCSERYDASQAHVLSDQDRAKLVHATCHKCGASTLALVAEGATGGSTIGLVTDLSCEDVLRSRQGGRVHMDDVIEIHEKFGLPLADALRVSMPKRRARAKIRAKSKRAA